jgi:hypothetical protein
LDCHSGAATALGGTLENGSHVPYADFDFERRVKEFGSPIKIIVKPGHENGWGGMDKDMEVFAQWFDEHLLQNTKHQTSNSR